MTGAEGKDQAVASWQLMEETHRNGKLPFGDHAEGVCYVIMTL